MVYVDDFMLACNDSPFGKHVLDSNNNLYEWRTWESRMFTKCGARITQAYDKHIETWRGFEISFTEYVKQCRVINWPSQFATDAPVSVTVDGTNSAGHSGDDFFEVNKIARIAIMGPHVTQSPRSSFSCGGHVGYLLADGPFRIRA